MKKVSSSNGLEKCPSLRFPEFDKPWKPSRFGNIIDEFNDKTKTEDEDILLSAAIEGMFLNTELFGHQRGASNKGYKKIKKETLVLSTQNLHLGNANVNTRFEHGMVSPAYKTYKLVNCNPILISHWIKSERAKQFFFDATTVGASQCRRNVEWDTLYSQFLYLPSDEEQEKLANFLSLIEQKIKKQQQLVELLKKYKRSLICSIMDRKFEAYNNGNEWKMTSFGNVADYKKGPFGSALKKEIFVPKSLNSIKIYEQQNAISKDWRLERYFITNEYANKLKGFEVKGGDIIVSCAGTIGELYTLPSEAEIGIINQALMRIRTNDKIVDKRFFIHCFVLMIDNFSKKYSNGSAIKNIPPFADLKAAEFPLPSLEMQNNISNFIELIENKVANEQYKLDEFILLKSSLLQQLFI